MAYLSLLGHIEQIVAFGFDSWVKKPCYMQKATVVVGGIRNQVLVDSVAFYLAVLDSNEER